MKPNAFATWSAVAREHPFLTIALTLCMIMGATLAWAFLPTEISTMRRIAGGAMLGLLSWLLVMMGRMLD